MSSVSLKYSIIYIVLNNIILSHQCLCDSCLYTESSEYFFSRSMLQLGKINDNNVDVDLYFRSSLQHFLLRGIYGLTNVLVLFALYGFRKGNILFEL